MKRSYLHSIILLIAIANGTVASESSQIRPMALSTFVSIVDHGDWTDPASWNVNGGTNALFDIPGNLDDVVINAGDTIVIDGNNARSGTLTLNGVLENDDFYSGQDFGRMDGSGTLIVQGTMPTYGTASTFFTTGRVVYDGSGSYTLPAAPTQYYDLVLQGSGTRIVDRDLTVVNSLRIEDGVVLNVGSYDLDIQGDVYSTGGVGTLLSTGTVTLSNTSRQQTLTGSTTFHNLTVDKASQSLVIKGEIVLSGDLEINSGTVNSGTATMVIGDDWVNNGTYIGTGTVVFNGVNVDHVVGGTSTTTFGSLEVNGTNSTFHCSSQVAILSDLSVQDGTFQASSAITLSVPGDVAISDNGVLDATLLGSLQVGGHWLKATNGTFTAGLGTVVFDGTTQQLQGATDFYGLEKSGGGTLSITDGCTVAGALTLTDGYISTPATEGLLIGESGSIVGGSATSYVTGPLIHTVSVPTTVASDKPFPFGSDGTYRPVMLSVNLAGVGNDAYYRGELHEGSPSARNLPGTIDHTSRLRYYSINQSTRLVDPVIVEATVHMEYNTDDQVDTPSELRLVKSDGLGNWLDIGGVGTGVTGTITSAVFSSFSDFVLGSSSENNPLPVELLSLTARPQGPSVHLQWTTASETDNSHFVVERAVDGQHFIPIATVTGAGTSEQEQRYQIWDRQPLAGRAYYRLRQVDFDGTSVPSRLVSVDMVGLDRINVHLYPNPANETTTVNIQGLPSETVVHIQLISPDGRLLRAFRSPVSDASSQTVGLLAANRYPPGLYTVVIRSKNFYWSERLLIE